MSESRVAKWQERASPFLEPGERVVAVAPGQKGERLWLIMMLVDALALPFMQRAQAYVVTDRNVYVCRLGSMRAYRIEAVLVKRPLGEAHVVYQRNHLRLDGANSLHVGYLPVGRRWAREVAVAAASGEPGKV